MAARKKNEINLAQTSQKPQDTIMDTLVTAIALDQKKKPTNNDEDYLDASDSPLQAAIHPGLLTSENSEGDMNTQIDLVGAQVSDDAAAADVVEPSITLDTALSIQNVVTLYEKLKKAYAAHDAIEIDASHVNSVDTATLQLFVALKKDAIKQKKEVDFFQPSPRFVESARLLDLLDILEITHV